LIKARGNVTDQQVEKIIAVMVKEFKEGIIEHRQKGKEAPDQ
jgi:hypothetical protein